MYPVARMNEAPKTIEIHWMKPAPDKQPPGGLGEPATAVSRGDRQRDLRRCGKRVRVLPLTPENIRAS